MVLRDRATEEKHHRRRSQETKRSREGQQCRGNQRRRHRRDQVGDRCDQIRGRAGRNKRRQGAVSQSCRQGTQKGSVGGLTLKFPLYTPHLPDAPAFPPEPCSPCSPLLIVWCRLAAKIPRPRWGGLSGLNPILEGA